VTAAPSVVLTNGSGATPTLRERILALRHIPRFLRLVWSTSPPLTIATAILRLVRALNPVVVLWVGKLIIDAVVQARQHGPHWQRIWTLVGMELLIVTADQSLSRVASLVDSLLGDIFTRDMSIRIMEHAATLDLAQFENPEFYNLLERARQNTATRLSLLSQVFGIGQSVLTLISLSTVLVAFNAWLLPLLLLSMLPSFMTEAHYSRRAYSLYYTRTQERRQLDYLRLVAASDKLAKEVQMFALAPWLIARFRQLAYKFYHENKALSIKRTRVGTAVMFLGTAGNYIAYSVVVYSAALSKITLGSLTFLASSFTQSRALFQVILNSVRDIYDQALYLRDLFLFFDIEPTIRVATSGHLVSRPLTGGFVFEDVGFRYPNGARWAIRHVSFTLCPGRRIALVGENGAGKTTLIKLLTRLYDPTEGRILLEGRDLREYDLESLRNAIGVIFQDFARYDFRFDENIGVGEITRTQQYLDGPHGASSDGETLPSIADAARKSLADSLLAKMPAGYRQMLGRRFEGGVDLSGGEWQKVGLARAYLRDAQVLVLDEPTSALDARAEYEVFLRFSELTAGRTAILISHRFSTVRMADQTIVLQDGTVADQGTHEELLGRPGLYRELFTMQAAGYR
jgi:ATP-binding cassette subfamily B protein